MPDLEAVPGAHIAPVRGEVSGHLDPLAATGTFRAASQADMAEWSGAHLGPPCDGSPVEEQVGDMSVPAAARGVGSLRGAVGGRSSQRAMTRTSALTAPLRTASALTTFIVVPGVGRSSPFRSAARWAAKGSTTTSATAISIQGISLSAPRRVASTTPMTSAFDAKPSGSHHGHGPSSRSLALSPAIIEFCRT